MASVIVQAVVILLDVIAFGLGVAAEQRRSKATVTPDAAKEYDYCVYDSDIATGYGVGALLLLAAAQVVLMTASRCFCCGRGLKPGGSRACALILFLFTWVTFLIAEVCLLAGSAYPELQVSTTSPVTCLIPLDRVTFLIAEVCLLAGSVRNAYHTRYRGNFYGEPLSCETVRKGVFAAGAAFTFFTAILGEVYYLSYSKSRDAAGGAPYGGSSIGMGTYN